MARLHGRDSTGNSDPLSDRATGQMFKVKGRRGSFERYEEAPPYDGTTHWYLGPKQIWRAFKTSDVTPVKGDRK